MVSRPDGFVVLLPVKSPGTGKSRLAGLSDCERSRLAAAFARDALAACLATPAITRVVVVSDDAE
ncbi:2-phospho-L-lactate guanylyltransferase, partial [Nocardioides sp.]